MTVYPSQAGQDFPILVYGTVTGVNPVNTGPGDSNGNYDGLQYAYYNVISSAAAGNALAGNIDSGAGNSAFSPTLTSSFQGNAAGAQIGAVQDLNNDGIADLGSTSLLVQVAKARSQPPVWDNFGAYYGSNPTNSPDIIIGGANQNSVSFLLETLYFQVGASPQPGQSTSFNPEAVNTLAYGPYVPTNYFQDVPSYDPTGQTSPGAAETQTTEFGGNGVQFTVGVPEPTIAISLIGAGAGAMLRRRRRSIGA